jgi:hypothetical protein
MATLTLRLRLILIVPLTLFIAGCGRGTGPELAPVSGRITLDGKPIEAAHIEFTPVIDGRPSAATSDSSGYYTLFYKGSIEGARLGEHDVTMTTFQEEMTHDVYPDEGSEDISEPTDDEESAEDDGSEDPVTIVIPGRAEEIPKKYAEEKLRVTVEPGSNTINLELTSD